MMKMLVRARVLKERKTLFCIVDFWARILTNLIYFHIFKGNSLKFFQSKKLTYNSELTCFEAL